MRLRRDKLLVITNGIDTNRFAKAIPTAGSRLGLSHNQRVLLFAGRLDPQKRPDWLLGQMPVIFERLPNHDLVIAGEGPLRGLLGRLAARLGISGRIHFVGWQPDMPGLLAAADLLLLTSLWEGMPNIVLEAMAAARPVVSTEVHGVRELLGSAAAKQVTPQNDAQHFVEAVVDLCTDRDLAARIGEENHKRAQVCFSLDAMVNNYCDLYDSLLVRKSS
jgi:glycosyltransferase involved in cell wall biosynthesis